MCMDKISRSIVTDRDVTAFKAVESRQDGTFASRVPPYNRTPEAGFKNAGEVLCYRIGKITTSPAPGIYCYQNKFDALAHGNTILEVLIPAGARAYVGEDGGRAVICAEVIKVIRKIR